MKNKGLWILFSVVVLLSLYTYFGEYQGKEKEIASKEQKSFILKDIKQDQINAIEINNLEQKIVLARDTSGWVMTSPVSDSADGEEIDAWLKQMIEEKSLSIAVEGTDIQWKYFGFDQPVKTITIKTTSNQNVTVEVSDKKNYEGNSFIRFPGKNQVLVASTSWSTHAGKKTIELRNKHIFRHQISNVQRIEIRNKKDIVEIENKDAKWVSTKHLDWALDQNGVRELITKIGDIKALEFTAEKDAVANSKKVLGLNESPLSLKIKLTQGDEWSAQVYQAKDKSIYVEVPKIKLLAKISNEMFSRLEKVNILEMRDFKLPFGRFDKDKVEKLSYETALKKARLKKVNSLWELDPLDPASEVHQEKVTALLDVVKNLVAKQYVSKSELKKDLGKQKVSFTDAAGQIYFELQFSESEKKKVNGEEKTVRFARTNLYPDAFLIVESEFEKMGLNDLIKLKPVPSEIGKPVEIKKAETRKEEKK